MATTTTNYNLTKPSGTESADIDVINANMDTIDTAVANKQDKLTAGTGLSMSGTTLNHSNSVTAKTSYIGSATAVPRIQYDAQGHITASTTATIYPPTTAGTSGQVWRSDGSGAGAWETPDTTPTSGSTKLVTSGAVYTMVESNKVTVDSALSSTSTNPLQNKVVNQAIYNQSVNLGNQISAKQDKLTAGDGITIENNVISATGGGGGSGGTRTATKFTKYTDFHNAFSNFEIGGFMNFYEIDPSNEYPYNGYLYFNGVITDKTSSNIVIDGRGFFFKGKYGWIDNSEVFKVEIYNNDVDYKIKVTYILQSSLNNSEAIPNEKDVLTFPNGANFHGYIVYVSP
ncbi:MAG: hypothetical protein IKU98_00180 [Bacteroidaceae bacterium]|nr:hypothetical protein [Bacteroidaceae bacterium]